MKKVHTYTEKNRVTEAHERVTLSGTERDEHVLREEYVAVLIDEDGRTLMSKVCRNAVEADEFLLSDEAKAACNYWHGDEYEMKHEDVAAPSDELKSAVAKGRGPKK